MNELYTDDEIKVTLDLRLSAKSKAVDVFGVDDDAEVKVKDFYFYMKNLVKAADGEWTVGVGGLMLDPVKNDWNDVTYTDEDGDVAFMKFFGDSDTGKFYAKLSTKWEHADYASYFNDQDAYIFQFTGSPNLSSASRAEILSNIVKAIMAIWHSAPVPVSWAHTSSAKNQSKKLPTMM